MTFLTSKAIVQKAGATACLSKWSTCRQILRFLLRFHISDVQEYTSVCLKPLQVFSSARWVHTQLQWGLRRASLFCGLVPPLKAVLHHRVQYLRVCLWVCAQSRTVDLLLPVCLLYKPGGVCVWDGEGFISEDISVSCLQPRTFFLSYDLICFLFVFFFLVCFSCIISFWWHKVLVPEGARLIRWTLQHWKLFLWGFDLRSAPLYFARPPLAAFTVVSLLLVRPRY